MVDENLGIAQKKGSFQISLLWTQTKNIPSFNYEIANFCIIVFKYLNDES